MCALKTLHSAA